MEVVSVAELTPGRKLAKPVVFQGNVLLDTGTCLTDSYISKLKKKRINYVYISRDHEESRQPPTQYIRTEEDYLEELKNFNPARQGAEFIYEVISGLASIGSKRAFSVLEGMMRMKLPGTDQKQLKQRIMEAVISMPPESLHSNFFLIQLRMSSDAGIKLLSIEGLKKVADKDLIYPFLLGMTHYPAELFAKITEFLGKYDQKILLAAAIKSLQQSEEKTKPLILEVIKPLITEEHFKLLSRI